MTTITLLCHLSLQLGDFPENLVKLNTGGIKRGDGNTTLYMCVIQTNLTNFNLAAILQVFMAVRYYKMVCHAVFGVYKLL